MGTFQDNNHFLRLCFKRSTFWLISSYQCIRFLTRICISPIDDHFAPIGSRNSSGAGRGHKTPNSSHQQPYPYPSVKWSRCAIASVTALSYQDPHWVVKVFGQENRGEMFWKFALWISFPDEMVNCRLNSGSQAQNDYWWFFDSILKKAFKNCLSVENVKRRRRRQRRRRRPMRAFAHSTFSEVTFCSEFAETIPFRWSVKFLNGWSATDVQPKSFFYKFLNFRIAPRNPRILAHCSRLKAQQHDLGLKTRSAVITVIHFRWFCQISRYI